ncbi:MAG: acetyl-CoA carboxylase [Planctomycetota bacterium]|nr:acetyl-CoA carboxylase [Planctomycetota bacterium]
MNREEIEKLILLMKEHDLSELQVREGDWQFSARRGEKPQVIVPPPPSKLSKETSAEITAPLVGTFYRSPSPDQPPFKEVGDRVASDEVVGIVEAMKVMNEIKAGVTGTIRKILVDNASPVEFGQPLFLVEIG